MLKVNQMNDAVETLENNPLKTNLKYSYNQETCA